MRLPGPCGWIGAPSAVPLTVSELPAGSTANVAVWARAVETSANDATDEAAATTKARDLRMFSLSSVPPFSIRMISDRRGVV